MSKTFTTSFGFALIPPTDNPDPILQVQESITIAYDREGARLFYETEQMTIHTLLQTFDSIVRNGSSQYPTPSPQSASDAPNLGVKANSSLIEWLRRVIAQKIGRQCAKHFRKETRQAVENGFSDPFTTGSAEIKARMESALSKF